MTPYYGTRVQSIYRVLIGRTVGKLATLTSSRKPLAAFPSDLPETFDHSAVRNLARIRSVPNSPTRPEINMSELYTISAQPDSGIRTICQGLFSTLSLAHQMSGSIST